VKRTSVDEFELIRTNGKIAISLRENDELIAVKETCGDDEILIAGSNGKAVRFHENEIRPMGRSASGVKGFNTDGGIVVGMATSREGTHLLAVSELGYGKRTPIEEYRMTSRGTKGVKTMNLTDKTGSLVAVRSVNGDEDLMIITSGGIIIRIAVDGISLYGRNTQGVKLINVGENEVVSKAAIVEKSEESDTAEVVEQEEMIDNPTKE
jgi:DNA gyrase subunit A